VTPLPAVSTPVTPAVTNRSANDSISDGEDEGVASVIQEDSYQPTYVYKNLEYTSKLMLLKQRDVRSTRRRLAPEEETVSCKVFKYIIRHYHIPADTEQSRTYGPWSGTTYEERVNRLYALGKLIPKKGNAKDSEESSPAAICTECAIVGHLRDECPELI
jgi:hypothetical protein